MILFLPVKINFGCDKDTRREAGHQFISNDCNQCRGKVPCLVKSCTLFVLKINSWQQGGDLGVLPRCWLIFALVQLDITSHQPSLFPPFVLKGESGPLCTWPCYGEFYLHIFIVCLQVERIIRWTNSSEAKSWIWWHRDWRMLGLIKVFSCVSVSSKGLFSAAPPLAASLH